jgi:small subunit ribosomal protein S17
MPKKKINGVVISCYQNKCVVEAERIDSHPKYRKRVRSSNSFSAHLGDLNVVVGEKVEIEESIPLSKTIKWKVVRKVLL